jgi:hypothetical protein
MQVIPIHFAAVMYITSLFMFGIVLAYTTLSPNMPTNIVHRRITYPFMIMPPFIPIIGAIIPMFLRFDLVVGLDVVAFAGSMAGLMVGLDVVRMMGFIVGLMVGLDVGRLEGLMVGLIVELFVGLDVGWSSSLGS